MPTPARMMHMPPKRKALEVAYLQATRGSGNDVAADKTYDSFITCLLDARMQYIITMSAHDRRRWKVLPAEHLTRIGARFSQRASKTACLFV